MEKITIAIELEDLLREAFVDARKSRHEFVDCENLLLAILKDASVIKVLRTCSANVEELRQRLSDFIKNNSLQVAGEEAVDTQPSLAFKRVVQRAIMHVQAQAARSKKVDVTGVDVLLAMFGEKDSHAVLFLHQQGMTRLDVINVIQFAPMEVSAFQKALDKANGEDLLSYRFTVTEVRELFHSAELGNLTVERLEAFFKKTHEEATV